MQGNTSPNTPSLAGWAIAFGLAVVGGAVSYVLLGLGGNGAGLVAIVLFLVIGVILGLPSGQAPAADPVADPVAPPMPVPPVAVAVPPVVPVVAPVAAPVAPPVAVPPVVEAEPPAAPAVQEKPRMLAAARDGKPDDLKLIKGVGPKLEAMLNRMGIFHFDQVAGWTGAELAWVDDNLEGFKGRASRDAWVAQARILAAGGSTEFSGRNGH